MTLEEMPRHGVGHQARGAPASEPILSPSFPAAAGAREATDILSSLPARDRLSGLVHGSTDACDPV